jgi:hypothetical protein
MKDKTLRLRLVVRRHSLPEVRFLFSIGLHDDPTIANLLEQVNDTVPLESPDWGLDDYVVEVQNSHGTAFECLHFQSVSTILDRDEEVIIRPILTVDRKKRRLSGRDQISTDGKHLVDGVPFGRPRLKVPRGRPPVEIPPLKRRRIAFETEDSNGEAEDDESLGDDDYEEDAVNGTEMEEDAPLMLTEYGENMDEPSTVRVSAVFDDADNVQDKGRWDGDGELLDHGEEHEDEREESSVDGDEEEEDDEEMDEAAQRELLDELRDIQTDNDLLAEDDLALPREPNSARKQPLDTFSPDQDLARLNKITALRRAFPAVDCHVYEDVLRLNQMDEERAYKDLRKSYEAKMTLDQMRSLLESFSCPVLPSGNASGAAEDCPESDAESTSSLVKHYDHHGFPPGSILNGSASRKAAERMRQAGESIRSPVHTKFSDDATILEPEKTQRSDDALLGGDIDENETSDSSSTDSDDSDDSDVDSDNDRDNSNDDDHSAADSSSDDTDSDESESEEDDDSDDDSGPEIASAKAPVGSSDLHDRQSPEDSGDLPEAGDDLSQSRKRKRGPNVPAQPEKQTDTGDSQDALGDEDTSDTSSESSQSRTSESTGDKSQHHPTSTSTLESDRPRPVRSQPLDKDGDDPRRHPPGLGLARTRARNARRKAARQALKKMAPTSTKSTSPPTMAVAEQVTEPTPDTDVSDFLKRKQALLESLANEDRAEGSPEPQDPSNLPDAVMDETRATCAEAAPMLVPSPDASTGVEPPASRRRSTLDVGAGRRMLFGALGLRNPKTKADEEKIRTDLMKGARPLVNHRVSVTSSAEVATSGEPDLAEQQDVDDPDAWKGKIIYRAVECCHDGVELSEPPFPFLQRWDPQQQRGGRDKNAKRAGRGKKKQRNQGEFYEDDGDIPSAKRQRVDYGAADSSYVTAANSEDQPNLELNYDDIPDSVPDKIMTDQNISQLTDMDDLPALPGDPTTLPPLRPADAKPGMVITWKQLLVSNATNWAPQLRDLTAIIVSTDEGTGELRVVLARRDRHLDGLEKTFDADGNRVYDRFEGPDVDDADGSTAEGYRTVLFSDMMDPRILQQPLPLAQNTTLHSIEESEAPGIVMDELRERAGNVQGIDGSPIYNMVTSTSENGTHLVESQLAISAGADGEHPHHGPDDSMDGSVIPDSVPKSTTDQPRASDRMLSNAVDDTSITDDRRHDISLLIQEAGFRADVTPSVAKEPRFSVEELSSPSRQLEEMSEAAAMSQNGSKSPGQPQPSHSVEGSLHNGIPASSDDGADGRRRADDKQDTPTPKIPEETTPAALYPQLPVPASSASSVRSGRQPDNDFDIGWGDDDLLPRSEDTAGVPPAVDDIDLGTTEATPTRASRLLMEDSDKPIESSPLPSLEELFCTASSRPTQTPAKAKLTAAVEARKPEAKRDLEYEEIMRRVDDSEGWEDDQAQIKTEHARRPDDSNQWDEDLGQIKEERWSQSVAAAATKTSTAAKPGLLRRSLSRPSQDDSKPAVQQQHESPPPISRTRRRRTTQTSRKFSIPEGSQVVSFLTSSSEPEVEEHYAEDSIDETYGEPEDSDIPAGNGWVQKALPRRKDRSRRGVSLSALATDESPRGDGIRKRSAASVSSGKAGRSRRKTSAKF